MVLQDKKTIHGEELDGYFMTIDDINKLVRDFQADCFDGFVSHDEAYIERWLENRKSNQKKYFFDGLFWFKTDEKNILSQLTEEQINIIKINTVEGQWLPNGDFEERTDIRTWVTKKEYV